MSDPPPNDGKKNTDGPVCTCNRAQGIDQLVGEFIRWRAQTVRMEKTLHDLLRLLRASAAGSLPSSSGDESDTPTSEDSENGSDDSNDDDDDDGDDEAVDDEEEDDEAVDDRKEDSMENMLADNRKRATKRPRM